MSGKSPQHAWNLNDYNAIDLAGWGVPEVPLVGIHGYSSARLPLNPHLHRGLMEIHYVAKGEEEYRVGDKMYHLRKGDIVVTNPTEMHSTGLLSYGLRLYWIQLLLPKRAGQGFLGLCASQARLLARELWNFPAMHFRGDDRFIHSIQAIYNECQKEKSNTISLRLQSLVIGLLLDCISWAKQSSKPEGQEDLIAPEIRHITQYLHNNPQQMLSTDEMAQICGLSSSRFKAKFRQQTGLPPREFLLRIKIEEAQKLMLKNRLSITDIAYHLGFSSSQYFSTVFRKFMNMSPSDFMKNEDGK